MLLNNAERSRNHSAVRQTPSRLASWFRVGNSPDRQPKVRINPSLRFARWISMSIMRLSPALRQARQESMVPYVVKWSLRVNADLPGSLARITRLAIRLSPSSISSNDEA